MTNKNNKKQILLNLFERKDFLLESKNHNCQEYREWVLNSPYKFATIVVGLNFLLKVTENLVNDGWWRKKIDFVLFFVFALLFVYLLWKMAMGWAGHTKIAHIDNQITRVNQSISEILEEWLEPKLTAD